MQRVRRGALPAALDHRREAPLEGTLIGLWVARVSSKLLIL